MATSNYTIINAALIVLVAVGGMVIYFGDAGADAAVYGNQNPWRSGSNPEFYQLGEQNAGPACAGLDPSYSKNEFRKCCADQCSTLCHEMGFETNVRTVAFNNDPYKECGKSCIQACTNVKRKLQSIGFDYLGQRTQPTE